MRDFFSDSIYKLDQLAIIMIVLIAYIGICVLSFASRYIKGDTKYRSFFINIILLICSMTIMVSSDHLGLLFISSYFSHWTLVRLMIHKPRWKAAKASGMIAAKNYLLSAICMASGFIIFYFSTGETSINTIIHQNNQSSIISLALVLLLISAMTQSAIWPFYKWLISSLNSPTPVSAIMHAGLINGGGFILVRFAPLYLQQSKIMTAIFLIGMITALLGTLFKLIQSDVKRMLACSTMGQMGFMFVQCGLGLFPLAIAHLFWHGMFKAYLFLASSSAYQEKRLDFYYKPKALNFISAFVCGTAGSFIFAYTSNKSWFSGNSTLVLLSIVLLAASQVALSILHTLTFKSFILAFITTLISAFLYGITVNFIVWVMAPMKLMCAQPLNIFHIVGIIILTLAWFSILFIRCTSNTISNYSSWMLKFYVKALNFSQPHPNTITSHRNHYQYQ